MSLARKLSMFWAILLACSARVGESEEYQLHSFERQQLTHVYYSEGASAGDLNGDDVDDVVYGPYWFAGPDYNTKHEIYEPVPQNVNGYADNFFSWVYDFNGDGWNDVFVVGFPATPAYVYVNPGTADNANGTAAHWKKHQVFDWVSNESPQLVNIVGDHRPELVCTRDGFFGFATVDWDTPLGTWAFHPISEKVTATKFGHGLGIGDVNDDGRMDVIHAGGWFEQPESRVTTSRWRSHKVSFSNAYGGAEMYAYDVDGDGDNDIITSHAAHEFGLGWYEQQRDGDDVTFKHHLIMGSRRSENRYGVLFSELHSVNLVDMDGDGLKDIVTGKTYWSHHKQSPMWDAGAVVYWFKLVRGDNGVNWIPYQADGEAGIGRQVSVSDVNADGLPDIIVGGMKGVHVLTHRVRLVSKDEWLAAQPKVYQSDANTTAIVDDFQGSMNSEWRWRRENKAGWKLSDHGLRVLVEPGNMWGKANDAKNILLRPVPKAWRDSADVSVQLEHHPKKRWEQANLVWYYSDAMMVKLGLEIENGKTNIVMGREENDRTRTVAIVPYPAEVVQLRLAVGGLTVRGYFRRPKSKEWTAVGQCALPSSPSAPAPQVSLQFYQGEAGSNRWASVSRFEMKKGN